MGQIDPKIRIDCSFRHSKIRIDCLSNQFETHIRTDALSHYELVTSRSCIMYCTLSNLSLIRLFVRFCRSPTIVGVASGQRQLVHAF